MQDATSERTVLWNDERRAAYAEAGQMLRHYSTNRGTALSLALPISIGALGLALHLPHGNKLAFFLITAEALLFIYAFGMFVFFSLKYEEARQLLARLEAGDLVAVYTKLTSSRSRSVVRLDGLDRTLLTLGILLHGLYYVFFALR